MIGPFYNVDGNWVRRSATIKTRMYEETTRANENESTAVAAEAAVPTATEPSMQPDITLLVGYSPAAIKFAAHRFVLCNCSTYFRTLLAVYKGSEIRISNIDSRTFVFLLDFMYTGTLDLNSSNVYAIFLAANLLDMTDVQNLCRQFLRGNRYRSISIVKPIPRRRTVVVDTLNLARTLKYQPLRINKDVTSIFKPVGPGVTESIKRQDEEEEEREKGEGQEGENEDGKETIEEIYDHTSSPGREENTNAEKSKTCVPVVGNQKLIIENKGADVIEGLRVNERIVQPAETSTQRVVLDVACCDGPVRFHKVLNAFYNPEKDLPTNDDNDAATAAICKTIATACPGCEHIFENYQRFDKCEANTNRTHNDLIENRMNNKQNQKHRQIANQCKRLARRYTTQPIAKQRKKLFSKLTIMSSHQIEVRNSTKAATTSCYSCKICGSKFPSYYFVHKHHKLHHPQKKP